MSFDLSITGANNQPVQDDLAQAQRDLQRLSYEMPAVAVRALNKAMAGTKTDMKNVIRAEYNIKAGVIDERMSIRKANRAQIQGHIQSKGKHIGLTSDLSTAAKQPGALTAKGRKSSAFGAGQGVVVNIKKSTGKQVFPRAFIQPGKHSGKLIVLRRPGKPRGQHATLWGRYGPKGSGGKPGSKATLDAFYGPHPETLYNAPHNWAKIQSKAAERLDTNIEREIDAEFRKQQGKWG